MAFWKPWRTCALACLVPCSAKISSAAAAAAALRRFSSFKRSKKTQHHALERASKILELVLSPATSGGAEGDARHRRLVHGCMQDLLEVGRQDSSMAAHGIKHVESGDSVRMLINRINVVEEDAFLLLVELRKRGLAVDAHILASCISSRAAMRDFETAVQLHAVAVKLGYGASVIIGTSLISLYSKHARLADAYYLFDSMPVKSVVCWTAMIAGYAQQWEVEMCTCLLQTMRKELMQPNDVTFVSLLSSCTGSASLVLGRSFHCLEFRMGFDSYVHVANALISMYSKCGSIDEACHVFQRMTCRDLVSWNSMISGFSQYGFAERAADLLAEMGKQHIRPDIISYLCVLSLCRHAGLVEQGRRCFTLMHEQGIIPELDHYSCMVDLLGRAGLLEEALGFIKAMPIPPNAVIWGSLLSSCRVHGNTSIGIHAAEKRLLLEPGCAGTYVQLANLYASIGNWHQVARIRKLMKDRGLKSSPGYSWIEIGNKVYNFKVEDSSHSHVQDVLIVLDYLACHMEDLRWPEVILDFHHEYAPP